MSKTRIFFRTFFAVLTILLLFGGLFLYYLFRDFSPVQKTLVSRETALHRTVLLTVESNDNSFFLIDIDAQGDNKLYFLPSCTLITFNGRSKTAESFYSEGGAEYLKSALISVAEINAYISFKEEFICRFVDEVSGIGIDMPCAALGFENGPQTIVGGDLERLLQYQSTLTELGKAEFKTEICISSLNGLFEQSYGISKARLYKTITKYARTDIKSTDFDDIYTLLHGNKILPAPLLGEYIGGSENIKFKISREQCKKLHLSD